MSVPSPDPQEYRPISAPASVPAESLNDSEPTEPVGSNALLVVGISIFAVAVLVFLVALVTGMVYDASTTSSAPNAVLLTFGASLLYWLLLLASTIVCAKAAKEATRKKLATATRTISFLCLIPATLCLVITVLFYLAWYTALL